MSDRVTACDFVKPVDILCIASDFADVSRIFINISRSSLWKYYMLYRDILERRSRCEYNYSGVNYSLVIVNAVLIAEKH